MKQRKQKGALLRAVGVIMGVAVVVSGVTFAALQSQNAVLTGSTITSTSANLLIGDGHGHFDASASGFSFGAVEPGGSPAPVDGNLVYLRNNGTGKLALKVSLRPNVTNSSEAHLDKIFIVLTPVGTTNSKEFSLAALIAANSGGTPVELGSSLFAGQESQFKMQVRMTSDALASTTSESVLTDVDLVFSGSIVTT